ncbi:MAG: SAM-dependent chlorinase/fluorinase [Chloroflexota bacterium]|nr:SAM-dependent chlorinase/fluorinase [Chloroflexota bacterium]
MKRIITLTTDFGLSDGFVGTMKGVILDINPDATIVDITHDIAPQQIEQGAFLFANAARYFPPNTIHVVVVDPGVGSARRPIAVQMGETIFVAPDNGVLSRAIANYQLPIRAVCLNRPAYWLPRVANTFHGRDIFAPTAAHLSLGVPLEALGDPIGDWVRLPSARAAIRSDGAIVGSVIHIDHFGNVVTNIEAEMLSALDRARVVVRIGEHAVRGVMPAYSAVAVGDLLALIGSNGNLEVAVRDGSAARTLSARIGDEVTVTGD